jgi:CheY-like chemotaxis protein
MIVAHSVRGLGGGRILGLGCRVPPSPASRAVALWDTSDASRTSQPTAGAPAGRDNGVTANGSHTMDKVRTFIVEDSSVVRENLIAALEENAPVEVVGCAEDEPGALQWLLGREHDCDLVIVDIFLRRGTGLGVLKGLAALDPHTKRVVLSNHATPDIRVKCRELGADEVFDKSNELDAMLLYCNRLRGDGRDATFAQEAAL